MTENLLVNAGFLDLTSGWWASTGMTLSVDETVRGAAGRAVLRSVGVSSAAAQERWLSVAPAVSVADAPVVEVMLSAAAFVAGNSVKPRVFVTFLNVSGGRVAAYPLEMRAPALPAYGVAIGGLVDTYWTGYGQFVRPAGAVSATIETGAASTASGQSMELLVLKPWLGSPSPLKRLPFWSPGKHTSAELDRACWPSELHLEGREGAQAKPFAVVHDAGAGRPTNRRVANDPARKLTARIRCNAVQRQALEQFSRRADRFWIVEPDSDRLCLGSFDAEGAPRLVEHRGGKHIMEIAIWLETA